MSNEPKETNADKLDMVKLAETIQKEVKESLSGVFGTLDIVAKKVDSLDKKVDGKSKEQETEDSEEPDDMSWLYGDEDKEDAKAKTKSFEKTVERKAEEIAERKIDDRLKKNSQREYWDGLAMKNFEFLADEKSDLSKETITEIRGIAQAQIENYGLDISVDEAIKRDPQILYNAASRVAVRNPEKTFQKKSAEEETRNYEKSLSSFGSLAPRQGPKGISQNTLNLAKKFNISQERLQKTLKNYYGA